MFEDLIRAMVEEATAEKPRATDYADAANKRHPIMSQAHLLSTARSLGRSTKYTDEEKEAIKARATKIAKRKGLYLPKAWAGKKEGAYVLSDQMRADAIQAALNDDRDPDRDGDDDMAYDSYERGCVRHVYGDGTFVFQMGWDGDWFRRTYTIDANGEATLGEECEQVIPQLTFATASAGGEDATEAATVPSGARFHEVLIQPITESGVGEDGKFRISGTAIMPGINRSGTRIYPKETLAAAVAGFTGRKMFIDHSDGPGGSSASHERKLMNLGGKIESAWINGSGGIDYRAVIVNPPLLEQLKLMSTAGALDAIGTSVNYQGTSTEVMVDGKRLDNIESLSLDTLDFVTEPGAWGDVARMESLAAGGVAQRREERQTNEMDENTIKKLFAELLTPVAEAIGTVQAGLATESAARVKGEARTEIRAMLAASGLPAAAQNIILAQFAEATTTEGVQAAIDTHIAYVEEIRKTAPAAPKAQARVASIVTGLGKTGGDKTEGATEEETIAPTPEALVENFGRSIPGGLAVAQEIMRRVG